MIRGVFKREPIHNHVVSFEISGHANAGPDGSDIVCAAVSALAFSTVNGIEHLAKIQPLLDIDYQEEGYMYVTFQNDLTEKESEITQILLENFLLGLQNIEEEYHQFVKIDVKK